MGEKTKRTARLVRGEVPYDNNKGNHNKDSNADEQAPPLLSPCRPSLFCSDAQVLISLNHVSISLLGLFLDVLDERLLLDNDGVQVLEELRQFHHGPLNLLNCIMALLHVAEGGLCLSSAVCVEQGLLEYLCVASRFCGLSDLSLASIWVDDEVLSSLLLLHVFPELALDRLEVVDCLADTTVQSIDLGFVTWLASVWLRLDTLDSLGQRTVCTHDVGAHGVDLLVCGTVSGSELALDALKIVQTSVELVNCAADFTTRVEDGIGIARGILLLVFGVRILEGIALDGLHFHVCGGACAGELV